MSSAASFLIEIAARSTNVDSAAGELAKLSERLGGVGSAAANFDAAIAQTSAACAEQKAAVEAAANALNAGEKNYARLEAAAIKTAKAVEAAALKGNVPSGLKANAEAAANALKAEAAALDQLRAKSSAAQASQSQLANTLKNLQAGAKHATQLDAAARGSGKINEMAEAFGALGGPAGSSAQQMLGLVQGFGKLSGSMGGAAGAAAGAAVVFVAVAAAIVAVVAAIAAAITKTAIWAVGLADAKRNAALNLEALSKTSPALADIANQARVVASVTTLSSDAIGELGKQLAAAGVSAKDMPAALRAAATAEAALAGEGAAFIATLKEGKKSVAELAAETQSKFGGIVARKMLSLDATAAKLKKNLGETFGGLEINPLLAGISKLADLLSQTTATGRTLKFLFEKAFQPLIDAAASSLPTVQAFLTGIAIGALKVYIALKPAIKAIAEFFNADTEGLPSAFEVAIFLGQALAVVLGAVATAIAVVAVGIAAPIKFFGMLYGTAVQAWAAISAGASAAVAYLQSISLSEIGTAMIQGLADGIRNAGSKVTGAIGDVVKSAISSAKALLQSHSPSRVFFELGESTGEGMAGGVERSGGDARAAIDAMVMPPDAAGMGAGANAAGAGGLDGATFNITINAPDGTAPGIAREVEMVVRKLVARDIATLGGAAAK